MVRGHVCGDKKEKPGAQEWYYAIEQETLQQLAAQEGTSQDDRQQD